MEYGVVGDAWGVADLRGEYDILGEIGRGGSAVVYRARDRALGRPVAVKVVHPRPTSPDDDPVARLAREARTAAQLQHPNIVAVYAVRRLRGGGLALVMQLVPGDTLKTRVQREGPLPPERCERVLRDVAAALAYAHARGVVHRDVKPENIFLDEDTGRAMLADFGIARSADADSMTMTGTAVGTPFYMSPEQVDGGAVDGRSDLYSLGLVAWEMLTGARPWDGESLYNVIYKQKHEDLPPVEALRPGVPLRLQYVVERMLQKRPAARWAGAEGLLAQLGHAVLPGDYGQWQRTLPTRVARHHQNQARRNAEQRAATATMPASAAATLHFARTDTNRPNGALAHTLAFPVTSNIDTHDPAAPNGAASRAFQADSLLPLPGVTVDLRASDAVGPPVVVSAPVYADAVEPSWTREDRAGPANASEPTRRPRARMVARVALLSVAVGGGAVSRVYQSARERSRDFGPATARGGTAPIQAGLSASPGPRHAAGASRLRRDATPGERSGPTGPTAAGEVRASLLAAGGRHTCALGTVGSLYCWGANQHGQLGDGTTDPHLTPTTVTGAFTFTAAATGSAHSCAATRLGDVYCWGMDSFGQLGDATTVRRNAPVRVAGAGVYSHVVTGAAHSCAVTTDGSLRCWGANDQGQLGDGTRTSRSTPQLVRLADAVAAAPVATVAAGGAHTCAALADGRLFCWGANTQGQLGDGTRTPTVTPTRAVALPRPVTSVSAGLSHTCALTDDGAAWCWGRNDAGQLGDDTHTSRATPTRVHLAAGHTLATVVSGAAHNCALDEAGRVWCWGRNGRGAVGDGTTTHQLHPSRVPLPAPAIAIAAGTGHSCATTTSGATLCWGSNSDGQLGDGTRTSRSTPTLVRRPPTTLPLAPNTSVLTDDRRVGTP